MVPHYSTVSVTKTWKSSGTSVHTSRLSVFRLSLPEAWNTEGRERGKGERGREREDCSLQLGMPSPSCSTVSVDLNTSFLLIFPVSIRDPMYLHIHYRGLLRMHQKLICRTRLGHASFSSSAWLSGRYPTSKQPGKAWREGEGTAQKESLSLQGEKPSVVPHREVEWEEEAR